MSAPYSDNLYSSMADSDDDENRHQDGQDYTAPTDGYFHASASLSDEPLAGPSTAGPSHGVPYVPNVMVADPSLRPGSTIEDKAIGLGRDVLNLDARATSPSSGQNSQLHDNPPPVAEGRPEVEMGRSLTTSSHRQSSSSSSSSSTTTQQAFGQSESPRQEECGRNLTTTYISPQSSSSTMGRPEHNSHHQYSSPPPTHSPRRDPFVERTPNIPPEAPPAYSPRSPTSQSTGYSTFTPPTPYTPVEAMGRPEEAEPLLGRPQSMGRPLDGGEAVPLAWRNRRKSKDLLGNLCLGLLTFTAILFVLAASFHLAFGDPAKQDPPPSLPPNEPVKPPVKPPTDPKHPDDNQEIPKDDQGPITFPHSYCKSDTIEHLPEQTWPLTFSPSHNITIEQNVYRTTYGPRYRLGVYGALIVRPLPRSSSSSEGELRLNIATNIDFPTDQIHISYDSSIQRLFIEFPRLVDWAPDTSDGWPCALVYATIWVPSGAELDTIGLESVHLDICTLHDLELEAQTAVMDTMIGWVTGGITETVPTSGSLGKQPPSMPAEYGFVADTAAVKTVSGGIQGNWYLKDLLSFETASGDVVVGVTPLEGKGPATLNVKTISGGQTVIESGVGQRGRTVPARDYMVNFESASGDMEARVAFGSGASFSSISGDMGLTLLPVVDAARQEKEHEPWMGLGTQSTSGDVTMEVLEPQWFGTEALKKEEERDVHWGDAGNGDPYRDIFPPENDGKDDLATTARVRGGGPVLKALASVHQATSGDINVKYPYAWEGMVTIDTLAADVALKGDELRVIENHKSPGFGRRVVARKGEVDGTSRAKIKTLSGDIGFKVV